MALFEPGTFDANALTPATRALAAGTPADPPPAHRINSFALQVALQSDPPGWWVGNVWEQYSKYRDAVAIAVEAYLTALKAAKFCVYRHKTKPVKKSVSGGQGNYSRDDEYEPVEMDHPLAQVLAEPSGPDGAWTVQQEAAFLALQYLLTGAAPVWTPNNRDGKPVRLFGLTTGSITRSLPPGSPQYPQGAYTVTPYVGNGGWMAGGGVMAPSTLVPAEELKWFKRESPIGRSQWLSKLDTGAKPIDLFECINEFRWSYFNSGIALDTVVMLPGADQETAERVQKQLTQKHGGAKNARKLGVFGGPVGEGAGKASIQQLAPNAKDLDFPNGFEQALGQVLAIFGVPKLVANFGDSSNYATFHGELRRFYDNTISPFCRDLSAFLTRALARPWSEYAGEYVIEIEPQIPKDVDAERAELQSALSAGAITVNEYRMATGRDAWDDGDEPLPIVMAKKQQAAQPAPMPGADPNAPPGAEAAPMPGAGDAGDAVAVPGEAEQPAPEDDDSPEGVQDATLQAALSALGMGDQAAPMPDDGPVQKAWSESSHARDDHGRFVSAGEINRAAADPKRADALRASVTNPEQRKKLDALLQDKKPFSTDSNRPAAEDFHFNDTADRAHKFYRHLTGLVKLAATHSLGYATEEIESRGRIARKMANNWIDAKRKAISQFRADFAGAPGLDEAIEDVEAAFDDARQEVANGFQEMVDSAYNVAIAVDADSSVLSNSGHPDRERFSASHDALVELARKSQDLVWDAVEKARDALGGKEKGYKLGRYFKAATPVQKPGGTRKVRAEGERWTGADGKQWTKKNGKVVPAPQQSGNAAAPGAQRYPSKFNEGITYGHEDDRDADDKAFGKDILAAVKRVKDLKAKLSEAESKLPENHPVVKQMRAALQAATEKANAARAKVNALKTGTNAAPSPAPQFDRAQAHAAILKTKGAKAFGFTEQTLAKMPEQAVRTIAAQLGIVPPEQHYAQHAAAVPVTPAARTTLQRAGEWADSMAQKHAQAVAQRLGIAPEAARRILAKAIRQVAEHALKNGGKASGTLKVGGQSLRLGVGAKRAGDGPPPREEAKDRPGTAAGSPIGKSMNTLSDPDGGFLVGVGAPRRRRRAKVPVAALVRKALYGG